MDKIIEYISKFLAVMLVLSLHEFAHSFAAVKCGDNTSKALGRYTLNPFAHFDLTGLLCFVIAGFGWAKPVPINPNNFKKYKTGCFLTSIAGVTVNYLSAFIIYPIFLLVQTLFIKYEISFGYFTDVLILFLFFSYSMSLSFSVFNFLPLYPLDGFMAIDAFSKRRSKLYWFIRNYGYYILIGLFLLGIIADLTGLYYLDILGIVMGFLIDIVQKPIVLFWGLFF